MSKPPPLSRFGLAIDWETSGYSMPHYAEKHQGISFGAVVFDLTTMETVEALYHEIKFNGDKYLWSEEAERVHGLSREYLAESGIEQEEAAVALGNLVLKYFGTEKVMMLGHRVYFDESFTDQLMGTIDVKLAYNPIRLDSAAIGVLMLGIERSDQLFEQCGLPPRAEHNSLEDIIYTLESLKRIKETFLRGARDM